MWVGGTTCFSLADYKSRSSQLQRERGSEAKRKIQNGETNSWREGEGEKQNEGETARKRDRGSQKDVAIIICKFALYACICRQAGLWEMCK